MISTYPGRTIFAIVVVRIVRNARRNRQVRKVESLKLTPRISSAHANFNRRGEARPVRPAEPRCCLVNYIREAKFGHARLIGAERAPRDEGHRKKAKIILPVSCVHIIRFSHPPHRPLFPLF